MIDSLALRRAMNEAAERERVLFNVYRLNRNAGADPLTANQAMADFSARLDAEFERAADLKAIKCCMERVR